MSREVVDRASSGPAEGEGRESCPARRGARGRRVSRRADHLDGVSVAVGGLIEDRDGRERAARLGVADGS